MTMPSSIPVKTSTTTANPRLRHGDSLRRARSGSTNLDLSVDPSFVPGAGVVDYTVTVSDPTQAGTIIATDGVGITCNVTVQIDVPIDPPLPQNVPPNAEAGPAQNTD